MMIYLRREEKKPTSALDRLTSLFRPPAEYVEDDTLLQGLSERRLNQRVLSYWEKKRAALGALPAPADISGEEMGGDWQNCFILDAREDYGFAKFDYLGLRLARFSGVFLRGRREWMCTVLDKATEQVERVLKTASPVLCDDQLTLFDGRRLLFRSVLLPLSQDGGSVTHLLGAANGKFTDS